MASTRISNDKIRINKRLQQSTDVGRYTINVPGNGLDVPFIDDTHVRMQHWGANRVNDIIGVENSLKNIDRRLYREAQVCSANYYTKPNMDRMNYSEKSFNIMDSFIEQPRWNLREKINDRALDFPNEANNAHVFIPFNNNLGTRMYEKDLFCYK